MKHSAFTLIELLIVVAIIAILAAIAVPNFLEAQVRSKVSRAQSDMKTIATALESYHVDYNNYPLDGNDPEVLNMDWFNSKRNLSLLTTPMAYMTSYPIDPFHIANNPSGPDIFFTPPPPPYPYIYMTLGNYDYHKGKPTCYGLFSFGPDRDMDPIDATIIYYDPTNGTISDGDIIRMN